MLIWINKMAPFYFPLNLCFFIQLTVHICNFLSFVSFLEQNLCCVTLEIIFPILQQTKLMVTNQLSWKNKGKCLSISDSYVKCKGITLWLYVYCALKHMEISRVLLKNLVNWTRIVILSSCNSLACFAFLSYYSSVALPDTL